MSDVNLGNIVEKKKTRKKNLKTHQCFICNRNFTSVRLYVQFCSKKCYNYERSKQYWKDKQLGIKRDPVKSTNKNYVYIEV